MRPDRASEIGSETVIQKPKLVLSPGGSFLWNVPRAARR